MERPPEKSGIAVAAVRKKAGNLGSLLSVFVLSFTVVAVLATGILSAYAFVIGILYTFANQSRQRIEQPALTSDRARAAHAGGD
jgi:hypothetical protein